TPFPGTARATPIADPPPPDTAPDPHCPPRPSGNWPPIQPRAADRWCRADPWPRCPPTAAPSAGSVANGRRHSLRSFECIWTVVAQPRPGFQRYRSLVRRVPVVRPGGDVVERWGCGQGSPLGSVAGLAAGTASPWLRDG